LTEEVEGDLEISSPGLFAGYWRLPEKTAEEFTGSEIFKKKKVSIFVQKINGSKLVTGQRSRMAQLLFWVEIRSIL